jgi:hypothetical protein
MNKQEWISQWIAQNRATPVGAAFVAQVMTAVTAAPRKKSLSISFLTALTTRVSQRISAFQSRPILVASGAVGGFLRVAVFLYVLLFIC